MDFTTKTQFLFKINKGISSVSDNSEVNRYMREDERPVPFRRMIYFGDGQTDIPCMKMVRQNGGHSIAVYDPASAEKRRAAERLILEERVNFVCPADYREGGETYNVVTTIIDKMKYDYEFEQLLKKHCEAAERETENRA